MSGPPVRSLGSATPAFMRLRATFQLWAEGSALFSQID